MIVEGKGIKISEESGVRLILYKWIKTGNFFRFSLNLSLNLNLIISKDKLEIFRDKININFYRDPHLQGLTKFN